MGVVNLENTAFEKATLDLMAKSLVWDDHMCMPLRPEDVSFLPQLQRVKNSGCNIVSINISCDFMPWENAIKLVSTMRRWLKERSEDYILVETVADVTRAQKEDKLGVMFDLEGAVAIDDHIPMIQLYYDLGVRWMLLAYNSDNSLSGGCQGNMGLTDLGREAIVEMERVGMGVCCSHTSREATMEIMEMATKPVIFSHSNPRVLKDHYRNIDDEMIKACAATGGLVGINGIGDFLGDNDGSTEIFVRHIDYVANLVGSEHVGLGTDYVFDEKELEDFINSKPEQFNPDDYPDKFNMVFPEQIPEIAESLLKLNYKEQDVRNILGDNHLRVAGQVWK